MREVWRVWTEHEKKRDSLTLRGLLGQALPALSRFLETGPMSEIEELLDNAPDLTPQVAAYLTGLAIRQEFLYVQVDPMILRLLNSDRHSEWQKLWLAHAAGSLGPAVSDETIEWLENSVRNRSPILAAYSADALGRLGRGCFNTLKGALDRVTTEYRLPIVWALGKLDAANARNVVDSRLDRLMLPPVHS